MLVEVKNRSQGVCAYTLPIYKDKQNLRRQFEIGEVQQVDLDELEALTYLPGGKSMLLNYLQVRDRDAREKLGLNVEPEYMMSKDDVEELLLHGSIDEFLDCLDFAPLGVLDLVKEVAVELPLTDTRKIQAIKDKLGFDVSKVLNNIAEDEPEKPVKKTRRTSTSTGTKTRRTSKVADKKDDKI